MSDGVIDAVVSTQAVTQPVHVSPVQAAIDDDSLTHEDDVDNGDDNDDNAVDGAADEQQTAEDAAVEDAEEEDEEEEGEEEEEEEEKSAQQPQADMDDQPAASSAALKADEKLKRPVSAYFLFCADKRAEVKAELAGQSVTAVAKALGERWKQLTAEQKQQYQHTAQTAKAAYDAQLQLQQKRDTSSKPSASAEAVVDPLTLVLPLSQIKAILHKDPAHSRMSKQAALALSYAVQLFVLDLSRRCWLRVRGGKRRAVRMEEVVAVVEGGAGLEWLRGEMRRMAKGMEREREAEKRKREEEREKNKENEPPAADGIDAQAAADSEDGSKEVAEGGEMGGEARAEAVKQAGKTGEGGKKRRKGAKADIDVKQFKSLSSMFSRIQEKQQRTATAAVGEAGDEIEEIEAEEVEEDDESSAQADKRQRTTEHSELGGVEVLSDDDPDASETRVEEAEMEEAEAEDLIISQRSKRRVALVDDDDV